MWSCIAGDMVYFCFSAVALARCRLSIFVLCSLQVISHNHYDHLDEGTVAALAGMQNPPTFFVPLGMKEWFTSKVSKRSPLVHLCGREQVGGIRGCRALQSQSARDEPNRCHHSCYLGLSPICRFFCCPFGAPLSRHGPVGRNVSGGNGLGG